MKNNKFNFWVGIDIDKSVGDKPSTDESQYDNMVFEGVASDDSTDIEGEAMQPDGFDLKYFLKRGLFNLDHLTSREKKEKSRYWIGEPISAEIKDNKLFVKGKLWSKSPEARAFWDKMQAMKLSGSNRQAGMSIEGKALERDKLNPKKITKALITNIALTFNPVNYNTYCDIAKGVQSQDFVEYDYNKDHSDDALLVIEKSFGKILIDKNFNVKVVER